MKLATTPQWRQRQRLFSPSNPPRPATQSQVKAIFAIARVQQLNINQLVRDRFKVEKPDELSIQEASQLIDSLKSSRQESS